VRDPNGTSSVSGDVVVHFAARNHAEPFKCFGWHLQWFVRNVRRVAEEKWLELVC
jgi:hypothetical protein